MNKSPIARLRNWLGNIPIQNLVDRRMAMLLQVVLLGFMGIVVSASLLNMILPTVNIRWQAIILRGIILVIIIGIPFSFLRRGYYRTAVAILLTLFVALETYAIFSTNLRSIAETLTFFTLAIVLAGLLLGRPALSIIFLYCSIALLLSVSLEPDPTIQKESLTVALNFILLNGLMSLFLDRSGEIFRSTLNAAWNREEELQTEIHHRAQMEAEREKLIEKLETNNAELERFTYTVSHDLRSPLVTIKGFIGMLEKDLRDNTPERIQSDFQRIAGATDKMDALLSNLLELSRIGRIVNPPEQVDLVQLAYEAAESVDARLRSKNADLRISTDLPTVFGDRIRLREVFENLLDNAVKYTTDHTQPMIEIGAHGEQVIFVRDNGIGIEPTYHTKIFSLFEKLDPISEGTGIGLALVKRIIETHGGRIWVESEGTGKGSTFCFTLPTGQNI